MQSIKGITSELDVSNITPAWKDFSSDLNWVHVASRTTTNFPYLPDLDVGKLKHAKIMCNEITPTFFGGKHEKILSFINLDSGTKIKDSMFYEFKYPLEVDINAQHINALHFNIIAENSKNEIMFCNKKPVFITLLISYYEN